MVLVLRRLFNKLRCQGPAKGHSFSSSKSIRGAMPVLKRWKAQDTKDTDGAPRLGMLPRGQAGEEDIMMISRLGVLRNIDSNTETIPQLQATGSFSDDSSYSERTFSSFSEYSNDESILLPKKTVERKKSVTFQLPDWDLSSKSFIQPPRCATLMLGLMPQIDEEAYECSVVDATQECSSEESYSMDIPAALHEESGKNTKEVEGCLRKNKDLLTATPSPWIHIVGLIPETAQDSSNHPSSLLEDDGYPSDEEDDDYVEEKKDCYEGKDFSPVSFQPLVTSRSICTGRLSSASGLPEDGYDCPFDERSDLMNVELSC